STDLQTDELKIPYIDMSTNRFLTIYRVDFGYLGQDLSKSLMCLGVDEFFGVANYRNMSAYPAYYNYNLYSNKLYTYPKTNVTGSFNVYGKLRIGPFTTVDDEMPSYCSETFLIFLQYFFAKFICSGYNAPWQPQKEELLKNYQSLVDSENNFSYRNNMFTRVNTSMVRSLGLP
ncbi:MAG: hypothetical protein AAGE99_05905, partial [Chlamydiota bacterium]